CRLDQWCCDMAWTAVAGEADPAAEQLLLAGQAALDCVIAELPGRSSWLEVARAGVREVVRRGFSVIPGLSGHGIGREVHEDPVVSWFPTVAGSAEDFSLEPGLVFTVEPLVTAGYPRVRPVGNGWTLVTVDGARSVHFEHTLAVTEAGISVLTSPDLAAADCV
ncbi:MAG: M24 family metallopeptidase, partial [Planctomycetaceae bacterium]|nr:M24 family metallopeptidase [Planctomycetaceae bacterium]